MLNSEILMELTSHPGDSSLITKIGEKVKGDGYYGRSDGLHTVQYGYNGFTGIIEIQATLTKNPSSNDWFIVDSKEITNETGSHIFNITGNYIWVRAKVSFTDGIIRKILINH